MARRKRTAPYQDNTLSITEGDSDQMIHGSWEGQFHASGSLADGVCGVKGIDTTYENTSVSTVRSPRSTQEERKYKGLGRPDHSGVDNPAPVDLNSCDYPVRYDY